jgi:hypothetical protein
MYYDDKTKATIKVSPPIPKAALQVVEKEGEGLVLKKTPTFCA